MKNKNLLTSFLPMLVTAALLIVAPMAREAFYNVSVSGNNMMINMPVGFKLSAAAHSLHIMDRPSGTPEQTLHYAGNMFPAKYHGGDFSIKYTGTSTPLITFQPMTNGKPSGKLEIFAGHTAWPAIGKPATDLALTQARDGSLYITDATGVALYRITYQK